MSVLKHSKVATIISKVKESETNTRKLYSIVNEITHDLRLNSMAPATSESAPAEDFAMFFMDKIKKICDNLEGHPKYEPFKEPVINSLMLYH